MPYIRNPEGVGPQAFVAVDVSRSNRVPLVQSSQWATGRMPWMGYRSPVRFAESSGRQLETLPVPGPNDASSNRKGMRLCATHSDRGWALRRGPRKPS